MVVQVDKKTAEGSSLRSRSGRALNIGWVALSNYGRGPTTLLGPQEAT